MSDRSTIKRKPERGVDEKSELYAVLDEGLVAHVGIICEDEGRSYPLVIPMFYARQDDQLLLHGSVASRLLRQIKKGVEVQYIGSQHGIESALLNENDKNTTLFKLFISEIQINTKLVGFF